MAPLEPWEKVLIDAEAFAATEHGQMPCTTCHAGAESPDKEVAHAGLVAAPSADPGASCGACHPEVSAAYPKTLHSTLQGYWTVLDQRSDAEALEGMFGNHCASCHASCGDCHVSRPRSVGGGLIEGHVFRQTPSLTQNCTACHGSRVGNEFLGKHEGLKPDVHFSQARMTCVNCHEGAQLHGMGAEPAGDHRYDGPQRPTCQSCHQEVVTGQTEILMHDLHGEKLSCQVCHSISYTSCDGCHVGISDDTGRPFFQTEGSYLAFLIGRNPLQSETRPYAYVPVRHVPIASTSFEFYGPGLLPNFESLPTWKYATPHNIQRNTPQTEACANCHGNPDVFLTLEKVSEAEVTANLDVIVETIPAAPGN